MLDLSKSKAFADDNSNVDDMMVSLFDGVENVVGKGEHAGNWQLPLFSQCFQKSSSIGSLKLRTAR